jgi:hypothetical protein
MRSRARLDPLQFSSKRQTAVHWSGRLGPRTPPRRLTYLPAWHFLDLPWHVGDPAGAVVGAGTRAPLGGGDEAEDTCCKPSEFNDDSAGTSVPAVVRGIATRLEGGSGECPVCAAVLAGSGSLVSPGVSGTVVVLGAN